MEKKIFFTPKHLENGNIIDQIGSIIVLAFVFCMILAYSAYGKITQERLSINNTAKEYLYKMEENGYMSSEDIDNFKSDMAKIGATVTSMEANGESTSCSQVTYGDKVILAFNVEFENPFFSVFTKEGGSLFKIMGFDEKISYDVNMSSTAKW